MDGTDHMQFRPNFSLLKMRKISIKNILRPTGGTSNGGFVSETSERMSNITEATLRSSFIHTQKTQEIWRKPVVIKKTGTLIKINSLDVIFCLLLMLDFAVRFETDARDLIKTLNLHICFYKRRKTGILQWQIILFELIKSFKRKLIIQHWLQEMREELKHCGRWARTFQQIYGALNEPDGRKPRTCSLYCDRNEQPTNTSRGSHKLNSETPCARECWWSLACTCQCVLTVNWYTTTFLQPTLPHFSSR